MEWSRIVLPLYTKKQTLYSNRGDFMKEFEIRLASVQDVQEFVSIATSKPYPICVRDYRMQVNGKSFMEMFCLHFTGLLYAVVDCDDDQLQQLKAEMARFLV